MRLAFLFCVLIVSGCSLSSSSLDLDPLADKNVYPKLQQIRIERWGTVKFNGILALRGSDGGLHYALIDAMGVTLLQAWADASGHHGAVKPTGPLAPKGLAPFLSEALARIYLIEPAAPPCANEGFFSVCVRNGEKGGRIKTGEFAGITYWQVEGELKAVQNNGRAAETHTRYKQPWLGVEIILQELP